jgi:hypothetical protein
MKKQLFLIIQSVIFVCLFISATPVVAQQSASKVIPLNKAKLINFKELANYQLSHPVKHKLRVIEQFEDRERASEFKPQPVGIDTVNFNITHPERSANSISPSPNIVFNGIISNNTCTPPDINGAVGNTYILESTNQEFDIFNKTGALNSVLDITTFFAAQNGHFYFDPHVSYNAAYNRYIITSDGLLSNNDGGIFIGISQTDDPAGNWYTYSFDGVGVGNSADFLDYPQLGYNNKWVVITANEYNNNIAIQSDIYVLNRAQLYNGTLGSVSSFTDNNNFSIAPAQTYDTIEDSIYLVKNYNGNSSGFGYILIGSISGTVNNPLYSFYPIQYGESQTWSDSGEIGATQLGASTNIESGLDTKIENVVYKNSSLWFTHTVYLPATSPTHCGVDWWQMNPARHTIKLLEFGRVEDPNGVIDYYYPSINVDANNDVLVGYCTSSPDIYASSQYSYHASTDPLNTMEDGYLFQQGQAPYVQEYNTGRNRYGDFTFTCLDPVDNSFWTFQEFASSPANTWGTVIANIGGIPCNDKPAAGNISTSVDTLCSGEGTILNLTGYTSDENRLHILWQQSPDETSGWTTAISGTGDTTDTYSTAPLTGTTYFRCIVTCLNSGLSDTTAPIKVFLTSVYITSSDSVCQAGNYNITANCIGGSTANWYISNTAISPFYIGDTLTSYISKDTTFYVNTSLTKHYEVGIKNDSSSTGGYANASFGQGLLLSAISNFTLDSVYVYPGTTGNVTVNLLNAASHVEVSSVTIPITTSNINQKTVVHTNFNCIGGTNYDITASGSTVNNLFNDTANVDYPYTIPGTVSINSPVVPSPTHYYFFYDCHITNKCISTLIPVNVYLNCTDVNSIASANPSIEVYPNPTTGQFNLIMDNLPNNAYTISLYNILGQKLMDKQVDVNSSKYTILLDASLFPADVYFIHVVSDNQQWTQRIIKL